MFEQLYAKPPYPRAGWVTAKMAREVSVKRIVARFWAVTFGFLFLEQTDVVVMEPLNISRATGFK